MTERVERCLNCGAALQGAFCASCGQRAVPPHPTVRELAGDAWHELSGYDGRIMATIRGLARPGFLTREYLEGRRAHYLPPVRVYLIVSVMYFVIAASAPASMSSRSRGELTGPGGMRIGVTQGNATVNLSEQDRAELLAQADSAPWFVRPMLLAVAEDPAAFRSRMFTLMPRAFFALVPVFAGILMLFYRGRTFPTALVFAVHVHAFAFVVFAASEAAKFTRVGGVEVAVGLAAMGALSAYALMALRAVFGGGWPITLAKAAAIGFVYTLTAVPAFFVLLLWASWR